MLMSTNSRTLIALALDNGQVRFIDLNSGSFTHVNFTKINISCSLPFKDFSIQIQKIYIKLNKILSEYLHSYEIKNKSFKHFKKI